MMLKPGGAICNLDCAYCFSPRSGGGNDTLDFDAKGLPATDNGTTITVPGYAPVTYAGFRTVNIIRHLHLPLILR